MFAPMQYLRWARQHAGKAAFDLATSGMPVIDPTELGPIPTRLQDPSGWGALQKAIARHHDVPEDEAVAALGTSQALWLAYASLLSPGDELLVESPAYEPLWRIAEGLGARVRFFERDPAKNWALDPDTVARAITPETRAVIVSNLHNPSGVRTPDDVLRELARITEARGVHFIVDEVYAPFDGMVADDGVFHGTARRLGPRVIACSSLTKCYGIGQDRVGWVVGPADVIARANDVISATCGMLPLVHAHYAAHAFAQLPALKARATRLLGRKRATVHAWVERQRGLTWSAPDAGLFGFVTIPGAGDLTTPIEFGLREHDVLVVPGAFFGVPNGFRLAWSLDEAKLSEALTRLEKTLAPLVPPP
jgi:aspartate/methionine/tyrosine aminotransferase